jgi:hypothetical protein
LLDLYIFPLYRVVDPLQPELPGFLVVPPEKEGGRGREGDLLVLYMTLNRPDAYNSLALKSMLQAAVVLYRKAHGTVTSGLRLMADHLNGILLESNLRGTQNGEPVVAMLNLVAIRDNILYIAQSGPTHSLFINPDVVQDFSDPLTSGRGLGATSALNLKYYQVEANTGDVFVMAPNPPEAWNHESLTGSNQLTLEHLRKRLLNQAQTDLQAVVIKFQSGPGQVHVLRPRGAQAPAAPIISPAATAPQSVPPASSAAPIPEPAVADTHTPIVPAISSSIEPSAAAAVVTPKEVPPLSPSAPPEITVFPPPPADAAETVQAAPVPEAPTPQIPAQLPSQPLTRADRLRLARARAAGVNVEPAPAPREIPSPPQPAPVAENEPDLHKQPPPARVRPAAAPRPRGAGKKRLASVWLAWKSFFSRLGMGWSKLTSRLAPAKPSQSPALSASTMLFIAVAIPLVVVAVAVTFYLQTGRSDQRNAFYRQALEFSAAAVQQPDSTLQRNDWTQAISWLDKAEAISVTDDSRALRIRIQQGLDSADGIVRLDFKPVIRYELPAGTKITRMAASSSDIYLLDSSQGRVMRLFLTGTGYELDKLFKCGPGPSGSLSVGSLMDMVILPPNNRKATVLATDANGVLLYCIPGTPPFSTMLTPPDNGWGKAVAIALESDTLFVLDVLNNAVWVYDGKNVEFANPPRLFFDKETPSLSNVADLAFYGDDLYLLRTNGTLTLCTLSNVAFAPTRCKDPAAFGDPRPGRDPSPSKFADASFSQIITTQPPDPSLYLLDANGPGIYHFSLLLNFQRQLRASTAGDVRIPTDAPTAFTISPTRQAVLAFGNHIYYGLLP